MLEDIVVEILSNCLPGHRVKKLSYGWPISDKWAVYVDGICQVTIPDRNGICFIYKYFDAYGPMGQGQEQISAADPEFFKKLETMVKRSVKSTDDRFEARWGRKPY